MSGPPEALPSGAAETPPAGAPTGAEASPPRVLNDRYEVLRPLGQGGMGAVYLVFDRQEGRQVALKSFPPVARRVEDLAHFEHEFLVLSRLRHPNVAEVYDFGVIEGTDEVFFTSEFLDGRDLFEHTEGLPEEGLADLAVQVCRGLSYVHSRALIHYDVKPSNIIVTAGARPTAKLIDFGLAAHRVDDALGVIKGTVSYLAPEVARHLPVDHRADLYSLGVTLFQCATRRLPFRGETNLDVVRKVVGEPPPDPLELRPGLGRGLREIILRLLQKDPGARFASGNEVIRALGRAYGRDWAAEPREAALTFVASGGFFGRAPELERLTTAFDRVFAPAAGASRRAPDGPDGPHGPDGPGGPDGSRGFVVTSTGAFTFGDPASDTRSSLSARGADPGGSSSPFASSSAGGAPLAAAPAAAGPPEDPLAPRIHLAIVAGDPGVGKSRLLKELRTYAQLRRVAVVEGHAGERTGAYGPFVEVLRGMLGLWPDRAERGPAAPAGGAAGPREPRQSDPLRRRLLHRWGPELVRLIPDLDHGTLPLPPRTPLAPAQDEARLLEALSQFLLGYGRARPLLVVLHDLERADLETLELLRWVARNLEVVDAGRRLAARSGRPAAPPLRLFVVASHRPGEASAEHERALARVLEEPVALQVTLGPLGPDDVLRLVESMLGVGSDPRALAERVYRETRGNPYFAVELMRSLVESGALVRQDDAWQLRLEDGGELAVPRDVEALIVGRLRRTTPEERAPLELLATLGRPATVHELVALAALDPAPPPGGPPDAHALLERLGALERRQVLLAEARDGGALRYDFVHAVAREAVHGGIPPERRLALHAACGAWLEERAGLARGAVDTGELVRHFAAAGDRRRALDYGIRAGDEARAVHATHKAIELYRGALALLPLGSARWRALLATTGDLLEVHGEYDRAVEVYERLLGPELEPRLEPHERVRAFRRRGEVLERRGDFDGALAALAQGVSAAYGQDGLEREVAALLVATASIYLRTGRYQDALDFCDVAQAQLAGLPEEDEAAALSTVRGRALVATGALAAAERELERALAVRRRQGDEAGTARALADLGAVALERGDLAEAAARFERALERETAIGHAAGTAEAATRLAAACRGLGDHARALSLLRRALHTHERTGARAEAVQVLAELGRIHLGLGEYALALDHLGRAARAASRLDLLGVRARALNAEAQGRVVLGDRARAFELASEALRLASLHGDAPRERAAALETLGLVLAARDEHDRAEQLLHEAQALFRAQKDAAGVLRTTLAVLDLFLLRREEALTRATLGELEQDPPRGDERAHLLLAHARAALCFGGPLPERLVGDLERAAALAARARDRELAWRIAAWRGRVMERKGDDEAALASFVEAMTGLRELVDEVPAELREGYVGAPDRVACRADFLRLRERLGGAG